MQLLNLTWGAGASVAAGIVLEKLKIESKPIQVSHNIVNIILWLIAASSVSVIRATECIMLTVTCYKACLLELTSSWMGYERSRFVPCNILMSCGVL